MIMMIYNDNIYMYIYTYCSDIMIYINEMRYSIFINHTVESMKYSECLVSVSCVLNNFFGTHLHITIEVWVASRGAELAARNSQFSGIFTWVNSVNASKSHRFSFQLRKLESTRVFELLHFFHCFFTWDMPMHIFPMDFFFIRKKINFFIHVHEIFIQVHGGFTNPKAFFVWLHWLHQDGVQLDDASFIDCPRSELPVFSVGTMDAV